MEQWHDEGSLRDEATAATRRGGRPASRPPERNAPIDEVVEAKVREVAGPHRGARLVERLREAASALDRERFSDARTIARSLLDELDDIAAVHRIAGLAAYRLGRWPEACEQLEAAEALEHSATDLPVLADAYRARKRWARVEELWTAIREESPAQETMAEGRIVAASAAADRDDLAEALRIMSTSPRVKGKVRDHHLRQWYVVGDLHDRAGDPIQAARFFAKVAEHDPDFVDVRARLDALGR